MKNLLNLSVSFLILIALLTSCNKTSKIQNEPTSGLNYKISEVLNKNLIKKFKDASDLQTLKSSSDISFDYSHLYMITVANHPLHSLLMIRQNGYNESNSKNYGFFVVMNNNDSTLYNSFIAETERLGKYEYKICYFNNEEKPIFTVVINSLKKTIQIINQKSALATDGCGQETMNCLEDAYTKHGWASVFASVATAFVPEVAAALAIDCAAHNCL